MAAWNWLSRLRSQGQIGETGGSTSVDVSSVTPNSSKRTGGSTATLRGFNFRLNSDGSAPVVKVNGVTATGVVFVDGNTLTFTIPTSSTTGVFDITVTIDGNVGTLLDGFTYYGETITGVSPNYGAISGGTQVTISGVNFDPTQNYRVVFGDTDATNVIVLDDKTIICTTPNHAVGFVNVILETPARMFSPTIFSNTIFNVLNQGDNVLNTFKSGFQYTLLVRGEDIRRNPGITISESLGAPPSTASFRIDGEAPAPAGGEKISIIDHEDNDRVLWAGTVQTVDQLYEGQTDQLAWDTKCVDFTWLANRKRPTGAWFQVSVSQVVKEIITNFCPGFTTNHVQTNLAKVSIILDGSRDLVTVLNDLAAFIGGGHWYFDFNQDLHFFHVVPSSFTGGPIPPTVPSGPPPVQGYITLYDGGAVPGLVSVNDAYYALRCQMVYNDGSVGALGMWSNLMRFNGSRIMGIKNIPIGASVGGKTVTARRLWYHRLGKDKNDTIHAIYPFCEIGDNTTTQFTTYFGTTGASVASVHDMPSSFKTLAEVVAELQASVTAHTTVADWGSIIGISDAQALEAMGTVPSDYTALANVIGYSDLDALLGQSKTPDGGNPNQPAGPAAAPTANVSSSCNGDPLFWLSNWFAFRYAYLYRDGSVSTVSPSSQPVGDKYMARGYFLCSTRVGVTPGPPLNDQVDCIARLVYTAQGLPAVPGFGESISDPPGFPIGYGEGNSNYLLNDPTWTSMVDRAFCVLPDNSSDHLHFVRAALGDDAFYGATDNANGNLGYWSADPTYGSDFTTPSHAGGEVCPGEQTPSFGKSDASFDFTPDPVPAWPNDDGPWLEDDNLPANIDDANTDLLHEDSGSQPFHVTTDVSQVRNRVFVIGSGSQTTAKYVDGSLRIYVGDITSFALAGGRLRIEDPSGKSEFADYKTLQQEKGVPFIELTRPLNYSYSMNSVVYNFYQADNVDSQKFMAKYELDAFGRPTDGIHEYTITDTSLKTVWQLYMRANAELELYSKPIITIQYATRDPNSRIGKMVHVDLSSPPCQGDFLIQSVTIDQIRDEGDQLAPRYTVRASSIRYDLNDLLLRVLGILGAGGVSSGGIVNAGSSSALTGGTVLNTSSFPKAQESWCMAAFNGTNAPAVNGVNCSVSTPASGSGMFDALVSDIPGYSDPYVGSTQRPRGGWVTMQTSTAAANVQNIVMSNTIGAYLEDQVDIWWEIWTSPNLSGCGIHCGFWNFTPTGQFGTNIGGISASYWSGTDSGWTIRMQTELNGSNRSLAIPTGIAINAKTPYIIRMQSTYQGSYNTVAVKFTINGQTYTVTHAQTFTGSPSAPAMPTCGSMSANGPNLMRPFVSINNITGTTAKTLSFRRMYQTTSAA